MIRSVLLNLLLVCSIDMANEGSAALEYNLLSTITSLGFPYPPGKVDFVDVSEVYKCRTNPCLSITTDRGNISKPWGVLGGPWGGLGGS